MVTHQLPIRWNLSGVLMMSLGGDLPFHHVLLPRDLAFSGALHHRAAVGAARVPRCSHTRAPVRTVIPTGSRRAQPAPD